MADLTGLTIGEIREIARGDAQEVLKTHWPSFSIPVNPTQIARELGASVFMAKLGAQTWGMLVGGPDGIDIYLDRAQPKNRYRFSCAHEIGHLFSRREEIASGEAIMDKRSDVDHGNSDEVYANEFAASLLMPEAQFREMVALETSDLNVAKQFEVSLDAVTLRRKHLGV